MIIGLHKYKNMKIWIISLFILSSVALLGAGCFNDPMAASSGAPRQTVTTTSEGVFTNIRHISNDDCLGGKVFSPDMSKFICIDRQYLGSGDPKSRVGGTRESIMEEVWVVDFAADEEWRIFTTDVGELVGDKEILWDSENTISFTLRTKDSRKVTRQLLVSLGGKVLESK